jgi:L-asparaginase II
LTELPPRDAMALLVVRDAMVSHPAYVSGTREFDTVLMQAGGGAIACKSGAEGVHGAALIPSGIGIVSKVLDGTPRARGPATMALLAQVHSPVADAPEVGGFARPIVYNRAGLAVGEIRARHGSNGQHLA